MTSWLRAWLFCALALLGVWAQAASADGLQAIPALSARVIDQTGSLSAEQKAQLENKLAAFEKSQGSQIVILMLPSTAPEDIAAYAHRVGDSWKIGRKDVDDGLLIVVALQDRKIRIEVAKTLEGAVPDLAANRIISQAIQPAFRAGDFAGGLNAAVDQITARIAGEALPEPQTQTQAKKSSWLDGLINFGILALFVVPMVAGVLSRVLGHKLGALATAAGAGALVWLVSSLLFLGLGAAILVFFYALLALSNPSNGPVVFGGGMPMGGWGGGSGGGFGGGFSSGGGGDFGGGGASGDW
jgi:uncharacterized protein